MPARVFARYASYYDLLYRDKDYGAECAFIERILRDRDVAPPARVLDVGCGTGGHALPLARRGYDVTGVDASAEMLFDAERKVGGLAVKLVRGDMRSLNVDGSFAAGLCMFASLGYQLTNDDVEATLASVRTVLQPGAPFIFDVWNGLAVLRLSPEQRVKEVSDGDLRLLRVVRPELDAALHLCHDHYRLLVIDDGRILDEIDETHSVRYFFPQEIAYFLDKAGFRVEHMSSFPDDGRPLDETVWNMAVVAIATNHD